MQSSKPGDHDAQRTHWVQQQHKGRNEGYTKWNKENSIGKQQWRGWSQDSNQRFRNKEEVSIQPEQKEETRIQKNGERIRRLWDISKSANIRIIGMPEEEEQETENLFEKIMKKNFPNLVKEIDI